jgi:hypothetical protein
MSDSILTDLPRLTATTSNDWLYVVGTSAVPTGVSNKITVFDFLNNLSTPIETSSVISATSIVSDSLGATNYTGTNISVTYVNAVTGEFNKIITDFLPLTANTNITATYPDDNSQVYHLDTSAAILSVILPSSLPNGFNLRVTNIGTNTVYVSSTQTPTICAFSNKCTLQFGSLFIYKVNDKLFGTGDFFR